MYAVSKENRATKFFVKTRIAHIPQKLDNFDTSIKRDAQDLNKKEQLCTISKPLINEKRFQAAKNGQNNVQQEISAQHEAMIRFIHSSWRCIKQELDYKITNGNDNLSNGNQSQSAVSSTPSDKIKYINGCTSSSIPKNFVPFDLESFWGQRIYQNLLQSS
ncbi:hypothetical protein BLOT_006292 [Blomia tropicalis]|nr:hypothetical protein BLOT_006292 [Blomia tropicalis]